MFGPLDVSLPKCRLTVLSFLAIRKSINSFAFSGKKIVAIVVNDLYRTLGTPNETVWPGVTSLPEYQPSFPQHTAPKFASLFPELEPEGIDLLQVFLPTLRLTRQSMLQYEPSKRITAKNALSHPYFRGLQQ